jgi:hypothetical protein
MRIGRVTAALGLCGALAAGAIGVASAATSSSAPTRKAVVAAPPTRYSLVNGCYDVLDAQGHQLAPSDAPFRMQATALGQYLLYGVHDDFLGQSLAPVPAPSIGTVWRVDGTSTQGFTITNVGSGTSLAASFLPASGCAVYPEAEVDAVGTPFTGASPEAQVTGTIDAHTHVTAYEFLGGDFHCGRPWDPFGIPYALGDCASDQQGTNGQVESFIDYGAPLHQHDTRGWPTFRDWPSPTDLAEEGDYWTGIKRAWMAGLRIFVTHLVDNEALCELMTKRHNPCNDMNAVRLQARDLRDLQDYIDAQSGGPGKGFFRIVTNPFQARQVINEGKLAVVVGIEVSHLFNCGEYLGVPQCDQAQVDAGLKEVRALGVSTFFPVHKFDNAFGGTKMDSGELGALVNAGNFRETGSFWNVQTCTGPEHDNTQLTVPIVGSLGPLLNQLLQGVALPLYPPPPHCNTRGLTDLGAYLINQMIQQHFIVELDHMDAKTADQALSIIEAHHYSGVISAHSWDSPQENAGIYSVGGFVTPGAGSSPESFLSQWRDDRQMAGNPTGFGFGYGADMNGLAQQSQPTSGHPISYPFKSSDGAVTFTRERWGQRVFDLNTDGLANYGMYADWLQELQVLAGPQITTDMFRGAEAYLEMWERAYGVPATSSWPTAGQLTATGVGSLKLGDSFQSVLYRTGQPMARLGQTYAYGVADGRAGTVAAVFDRGGRVAMVLSTAPGYRAGGLRPVSGPRPVARVARSLGGGVWLGRRLAHGARFIYGVQGGGVRWVGVLAGPTAGRLATLGRVQGLLADAHAAGAS